MSYLTVPIVGGLGNQLFMIAAAFRLKELIPEINLVLEENRDPTDRPKYWDTFFADCPEVQSVLVKSLPSDSSWITLGDHNMPFAYDDLSATFEQNRRVGLSVIYKGYFQNWRYLPRKSRIYELFNIADKQERVREKIQQLNLYETCSIHFRLGDFKTITEHFPLASDTYYRNALKVIRLNNPNITSLLIFNEQDDQAEVQERIRHIVAGNSEDLVLHFASSYNLTDWEELMVMSICGANVIANSTFSWWGSYLNCHLGSTTVYPSVWKNGSNAPLPDSLNLPHLSWIECRVDSIEETPAPVLSRSPSVCIDVGSHDGADALKLSSLFSTVVYAFEPHPRFFALTVNNTRSNRKIEVLPYAVSDSSERFVTLNESRGNMSHSILPFKSEEQLNKYWPNCGDVHPSGRSYTVRLTRLDNFLDSRGHNPESLSIEYLHVDAQGVDLEVLKSLGSYLHCVKTGRVEAATTVDTASYEGQKSTIDAVRSYLEENDFVINAVRPYDLSSVIPCEQDIYFSKKKV